MEVEQQVSHLRRNVVEMGEGEVELNWDSSAFVAEHMSMEVAPRLNPREGWFKKDVVQPMEAWAAFTPYLASIATMGPFEQMGGFADPVRDPPPPQPLLYLPMVVGSKMIRALLDSGASDSFVSWDVVRVLRLRQYPLSQWLTVRVAK